MNILCLNSLVGKKSPLVIWFKPRNVKTAGFKDNFGTNVGASKVMDICSRKSKDYHTLEMPSFNASFTISQ